VYFLLLAVAISVVGCSSTRHDMHTASEHGHVQALMDFSRWSYEHGRLDDARMGFVEVLLREPDNLAAAYYLKLVVEAAKAQHDNVRPMFPTYPPQLADGHQ